MTDPFGGAGGGGWFGGGPPGDGSGVPSINWRRVAWWGGGIVTVITVLAVLAWALQVYADLLWFGSLGFRSVFRTILLTRIWLFFAGGAIFALIAAANIFLTYRFGRGPEVAPLPPETLRVLRPLVLVGVVLIVLITSLIFGGAAGARWSTILGFLNATSFGVADPQFNRDVAFYVFTLPIHHFVQGWLLGSVIVTALMSAGMYFVHFSLRGAVFALTAPVRIHLSVLGALLLLVFAYGYWIDIFDLTYSTRGAVVGATYADVHAQLPALRVLIAVVVAGAVILLANAFWVRGIRLLVGVGALWIAAAFLVGVGYPSVVQRVQVNPNELRRETMFITRNIEMTRAAFGLDRIDEQDYPLQEEAGVDVDLVRANWDTVQDVRLWDYRPFRSLLNQVQFFRPYYTFPNVDADRYVIDDGTGARSRQVMIGARELDVENLPDTAQNWVNRKLQFTHGYGAVVAPVTEFTERGRPTYFLQDMPPSGIIPLDRPEVYYGESREDFVIVNSNQPELDYEQEQGDPVYARYKGDGGVQLSGFLRRLVYAWQFRDVNLLISGEINPESRIQYRRTVQDRVAAVAPFLKLDEDPYIVVSGGKLYWIQDAYTITDRYPYSTPLPAFGGEVNYIRNSVKVVLDVYGGGLTFYVVEPNDPLVRTLEKIFPDLFVPLDDMPEDLRAHIRYPEDLFTLQATQYLIYHMTDPTEFFNKADQWAVPEEFFADSFQTMEPYFQTMRLPGQQDEEFVLLLPFTPVNKINMSGWLAARSDGEHYGKLLSFAFPKGEEILGPQQVEANIAADSVITRYFTLVCEAQARCIRGNLLVIPLEGSDGDNQILYAEPLYLQAQGVSFPELKQVILASDARVVMGCTLEGAMALLTGAVVADPRDAPGECLPKEIVASFVAATLSGVAAPEQPAAVTPPPDTSSEPGAVDRSAMLKAVGEIAKAVEGLQQALESLRKLAEGDSR